VHGLDEHAIAENFANVVGKLKHKTDQSGSVEKLLVDVLKDCARHLDASAPAPRSASGDVPVIVHLVHTVSRPARVTREIENRSLGSGNLEAGSVTSETSSAAEGVR
jgi:hypothetical protein